MTRPRVLVACEFSGIVRSAFARVGWEAWSCDLLPTEWPANGDHYVGDVLGILDDEWDLMIAHPPCTHLSVSGAQYFDEKTEVQGEALNFALALWTAPIPYIVLENPVSILSSFLGPATQKIHPWQFGHGEEKGTCLWLKGLPKLQPTNVVTGRYNRKYYLPPSPTRWMERSRTYTGIASAMASQWGPFVIDAIRNAKEKASGMALPVSSSRRPGSYPAAGPRGMSANATRTDEAGSSAASQKGSPAA